MSDRQLHMEDHKAIMAQMDCTREVAANKMEIVLLKERLREMKEDKEKAGRQFMWIGGMAFTIIMAVAGSAIQQNATVQVLQEKVTEQKDEINKLNTYIQDVDANLRYDLDQLRKDQ